MKAIQATYLSPTNTKPSRVKVWAKDCKPLIESVDYDQNFDCQAYSMALRFSSYLGWDYNGRLVGGTLPNGDLCFVFSEV